MDSDPELILREAVELLTRGYPVILTDEHKNPGIPGVGTAWPTYKWTAAKFADFLKRRPNLQIGMMLGHYIDIEIDVPTELDEKAAAAYRNEAEQQLANLGGNCGTITWTSRRGIHRLFKLSPEQRELLIARQAPASKKLGKLEFRLGVNTAAQSLIPPSLTDNFERRWLVDPKDKPALLVPDGVLDFVVDNLQVQHDSNGLSDDSPTLDRPGDIFGQRVSWEQILTPHGWKRSGDAGNNVTHWIRPGKSEGIGGTTGFCKTDNRPDCFYSFSDSPEILPLEPRKSYSKFEAYCILDFDGDFGACTAELVRQGYCKESVEQFDGSEFDDIGDFQIPERANLHVELHEELPAPPKPPKPPKKDYEPPSGPLYDNAIGRYVVANDPFTEADPLGVLTQSWEIFGNWIGKGAKFDLNNSVQYANGYLLIVGETSKARKGTSWNDARAPYLKGSGELPDYNKMNISGNAGSGEGIMARVDDKSERNDGRLMMMVPELATLMSKARRAESTLSGILREAYDGGILENITKNSSSLATKAHISMVAHVTLDEFRTLMGDQEIYNGLLNRMQFTIVKREKRLPDPGNVPAEVIEALSRELNQCRDWIEQESNGTGRTFYWSQDAKKLWTEFYCQEDDAEDRTGIFGRKHKDDAISARLETHVIRNAMRHAALDRTESISLKHLECAIELGKLSTMFAKQVLRGDLDDDSEKVVAFLKDNGAQSRSEISKSVFNNHIPAGRLTNILDILGMDGYIKSGKAKRGKRSIDVYVTAR